LTPPHEGRFPKEALLPVRQTSELREQARQSARSS